MFRAHIAALLITKENIRALLQYHEEHVFYSTINGKMHFSDESKLNVFGSDGKQFVGKIRGERILVKYVK